MFDVRLALSISVIARSFRFRHYKAESHTRIQKGEREEGENDENR